MNHTEWEIVKLGTWLYAGEIVCDIRILKHGWRYGSGDYEDELQVREDKQGEFYYIQYGSTVERGIFSGHGGCYNSLEEAMNIAYSATHGTVVWSDDFS